METWTHSKGHLACLAVRKDVLSVEECKHMKMGSYYSQTTVRFSLIDTLERVVIYPICRAV